MKLLQKITLSVLTITLVTSVPTQETKKCARKLCKTECQKSKAWYDFACVSCFSEKCMEGVDKESIEFLETDCMKTICHDNCQHSNVTPCKRCLVQVCDVYQKAGHCQKNKMMVKYNNKAVPLGDDFFMRSSNNYVQECDADGFYAEKQCDDFSGFCTCVDRETGENLPNTDFASIPEMLDCEAVKNKNVEEPAPISLENRSAEQPNGPCNRKLLRFQSKPDRFSISDYPECDETGFYKPMQCGKNGCWCVNKQGNKIQGSLASAVEVKSEEDCLTQRSSGGVGENMQKEQNPITPPNRDNIFGIPVTEEAEKVTESEETGETEETEETEENDQEPGFLNLLRPARIPDFNNKIEDDKISQRSKNGGNSNGGLCWQTGGICVDKVVGDVEDAVCKAVNSEMESASGYKCYSKNQVCCVVSNIDEESEILPWARVFSLGGGDEDVIVGDESEENMENMENDVIVEDDENVEDDEDVENTENSSVEISSLNSSQHHICGYGDLKVRCLEKGSDCRKSANMFFKDESVLETAKFDKTDDSVADCAEKCRENQECEIFTYHHKTGNAEYDCVLRKQVLEIKAVYTIVGRNTKSGFTCGGGTSCFSGTRTCQPI